MLVQFRMVSPEVIYTQTTKIDQLYAYLYIRIYIHAYIHTSNNNTIKERAAINLRVGEHRRILGKKRRAKVM